MNIVICDDESIYAEQVKKHIALYFNERNKPHSFSVFTSGEDALSYNEDVDMAFLDIEIGSVNGIDIAKRYLSNNRNAIIFFITAYDKYLDDAMNLNIHRFLDKPLNADRLYKGLDSAMQLIDNTVISFYLSDNGKTKSISAGEIIFVEIVSKTTRVYTEKKVYTSTENMKFWKNKLINSSFYAVHSSYIVNLKYATNYKRNEITLFDKYPIPIAYRTQSTFRRYWFKYLEER